MKIIYEAGDPVRLVGKRGLYRFVKYTYEVRDGVYVGFFDTPRYAEVVDPRRETARIVPVDQLLLPPTGATRRDVELHGGLHQLSTIAKERT